MRRRYSRPVNSKISNVGTGDEGLRNARRLGELAAAELSIPTAEVLMSSTGVIGRQLPMDRIEAGLRGIAAELQADPLRGAEVPFKAAACRRVREGGERPRHGT